MSNKPLIRLYDSHGIGVIIKHPSSVLYSNQVGGLSCLQWKIEGVFVPLFNELVPQEQLLLDYFTGPKWHGGCSYAIDEEDADKVDEILQLSLITHYVKVDRTKLGESVEAWIHVLLDAPRIKHNLSQGDNHSNSMLLPIYGFGDWYGILTWANSD